MFFLSHQNGEMKSWFPFSISLPNRSSGCKVNTQGSNYIKTLTLNLLLMSQGQTEGQKYKVLAEVKGQDNPGKEVDSRPEYHFVLV